jgi:bifunctional DNase/RNase
VGLGLGLLACAASAGARSVRVEVAGMGIDMATGSPVVWLVETGGSKSARELPIWIGPFEAQAIAVEMQGVAAPRPMTHDLMKQLVERLGGHLQEVVIEDLRGTTFFATVHLAGPAGRGVTVDARPSDAIALALRLHGPIMVAEELFEKAALTTPAPAARHLWGMTVQELTPEVAEFFRVPPREGVLVADVASGAPARKVARGDVITAVDGEPVGSVEDLVHRADAHASAEPVRLSIRREGRAMTVSFADE